MTEYRTASARAVAPLASRTLPGLPPGWPSLCFDSSCLIRIGPVATDQLVDEITVLGTGIRLSEPRRVEKCHGIEIDHGDIAVRQPRKPSSRKINMSRRRG